MPHKMIYNSEFPDGKEVELTSEEIAKVEIHSKEAVAGQQAHLDQLDKILADKVSGSQKLKDLGLTDAEITALIG